MIPAYGTNGLTDHRIDDALHLLADLGYGGVALTLDHAHLDPFAPDVARRTAHVARLLAECGLAVVIETGARYLLDPRRKHHPTLVSDDGRERRTDLLLRAVEIAVDLGAPVVHLWSGILPEGVSDDVAWGRVLTTLEPVLDAADRAGVTLAVEPEPGMFLERAADVDELLGRAGRPENLRMTLDLGHLTCNEADPVDVVRTYGPLVAHVQVDDMRRGVHEHLELGDGEVDLPPLLAGLAAAGYPGLLSVELARHNHAAPRVATSSLAAVREAAATAGVALGGAREEHRNVSTTTERTPA
ncbi:sugar phosphate isomerase/epimerase family protein [Litorihabitans aurantiacus]|uniref:Xylose isomerase n=1 Tax=Litorihabitans aurantiacus TaxID=1930061 RepID=A0AA37XH54_9MICO|nr:sugar phosphate isomerase/epimerase family protein [Litorihabitans aurantiacus]GMA32976.1 xylose isomerase [Litorihabitans aurantiacus]